MDFVAPLNVLRKRTDEFIEEKLIEASCNILTVDRRFKKSLHEIAVAFNEPEFRVDDLHRWVHRIGEDPGMTRNRIRGFPATRPKII